MFVVLTILSLGLLLLIDRLIRRRSPSHAG